MIVYIIISPNFDMLNIYVGKENEAKGSTEELLESYLTMLDLEPNQTGPRIDINYYYSSTALQEAVIWFLTDAL